MASKCAIFHVPPPMSVKFKSPAVAAQEQTSAMYTGGGVGGCAFCLLQRIEKLAFLVDRVDFSQNQHLVHSITMKVC